MDLRAQTLEALVLRSIAYGDADAVLQLLVRGKGRISAFARGARSSRKRFAGALEPFQVLEVMVVEKADLWALREARVVEGFPGLREDLHRIAHAGYASEVAHDLTRAGEPADELFDLLRGFLAALARGVATSARLRAYELGALDAAGLTPQLYACARCGDDVPAGRAAFDPDAGGIVCARDTPPGAPALTHGARLALVQLQQGGIAAADAPQSADGSGRAADARAFEEAAAQSGKALGAFIAHHVGRTLKTLEFMEQVGARR